MDIFHEMSKLCTIPYSIGRVQTACKIMHFSILFRKSAYSVCTIPTTQILHCSLVWSFCTLPGLAQKLWTILFAHFHEEFCTNPSALFQSMIFGNFNFCMHNSILWNYGQFRLHPSLILISALFRLHSYIAPS